MAKGTEMQQLAERRASEYLSEVKRLIAALAQQAEAHAAAATWPAVGSLEHIAETLRELVGEEG